MTNCDFLNIGFIGFGLIGGSIAKAIKAAHPKYHIIVESRSREPLIAALNDKIIYAHVQMIIFQNVITFFCVHQLLQLQNICLHSYLL